MPEQWRFGDSRRLSVRGVQIGVRVLGLEAGEQEDMGGYSSIAFELICCNSYILLDFPILFKLV